METINELIEKYFRGETSLDEERMLKEYFASDDVSDENKYLIPVFKSFEEESKVKMPVRQQKKAKTIKMSFVRWISVAGIAASVVLAVTIFKSQEQPKNFAVMYGQRIEDEAYAQKLAQEKLAKVNTILERNLQPVEALSKVKTTLRNVKQNNQKTKEIIESINR